MAKTIHSDTEALKGCIDSMNELLAECTAASHSLPSAGSDSGLTHNRILTLEQAIADCETAMTTLVTLTVDVLQKSYDEIIAVDQAAAGSY